MFQRIIAIVVFFFVFADVGGGVRAQERENDYDSVLQRTDERSRRLGEMLPQPLEGELDAETYVLGPWDELLLILKGPETQVHKLVVLPEGNVLLPNVGAIHAAGSTLAVFRTEVKKALGRYYRNMDIDCQLARPRAFAAYVLGEVVSPKAVTLTAPFRVGQAIAGAGGINERGSLRRIEIRGDDGKRIRTVDMFLFLKRGDFEHNPTLEEGQSIYVPPRKDKVEVMGEVLLPATYELAPGETAADLLSHAGGLGPLADPDHMLVERGDDGSVTTFTLETASGLTLEDADIIIVRDKGSFSRSYRDPVLVFGGGGRHGWINVEKEEPLAEFLSRLWRFQPQFDIESAVLERDTEEKGVPTHVVFDAREVLNGGENSDLTVRPGDKIGFPPLEQKVFVAGNVNLPGAMDFQPGFTADRYVAMAGGPSDIGSFDRLTIYSADGGKRGGDRNSLIYRGDTIVVNRKASSIFGTVFIGLTSLTSLVLAIVAVTK